ncbi:MAG: FKBP-type peptidyl-prolyl cis-trans isomerase [Dehalococcoidia bacterium]
MRRILALSLLPLISLALAVACGGDDDDTVPSGQAATPTTGGAPASGGTPVTIDPSVALQDPTATGTGLLYEDITVGGGDMPAEGKQVSVHYTLWLADGTLVQSSVDIGQPLTYVVGQIGLIDGWEEGLATMREGGTRRLQIPPDLGYGPGGFPPDIPGNATLVFELQLLEVSD